MAEGVRLHHKSIRGPAMFLLHEPAYRNAESQGGVRKAKVRPLLIDEHGDTFVSLTVWRRLEQAGALGRLTNEFILMNAVPDPPKLGMHVPAINGTRSAGTAKPLPTVEQQCNDAVRQIAPQVASFSVVPSNKYRPPIQAPTTAPAGN